jgi:CubicO group peptidase (beta-lactamase class C family)
MGRWLQHAFGVGLLVAGCVGVPSVAQSDADEVKPRNVETRLDEVARSYTPGNAFMGSVLVVQGDKVLLDKGYGMASLEWSIPNSPETKFRLGSLTKQFTATLILLLQQDGKLNVADPVSKYLPDAPKSWEKITIANLLGHTSGIPNFTSDKGFSTWSANAHTPAELIAFFRDKPLDFEPGAKFDYSNSNYEVLGVVIEKVSGKAYRQMLRERLFDPLGMKDTGLDDDELVLPKRAQGYAQSPFGLVVARSESMSVPWAAGSVYSTTGDLLKWEHGLFGDKVLSEASLKAMTTPGKGGYGYGLGIDPKDGYRVISHGGGIEGFNTELTYVPEKQIAVVVLANVNGVIPGALAGQLLDVTLGKTVILATERKEVTANKEQLAKFVGAYELAPEFSLIFAMEGDVLTAQGTGQKPLPLVFLGEQDGHPRFFNEKVSAEIEFVPDGNGSFSSLVLHQGGRDVAGKRK